MPDLTYPNVQSLISAQKKRHITESRAFLAWVLENIYRLDSADADDCVCDGSDDKGIDGIYVDDNSEVIEVFQSKLYQNNNRTLGDSALRDFAGAIVQFDTPERILEVKDSTKNIELRGRIEELDVAGLVAKGYEVHGTFVTNASVDPNGQDFLDRNKNISLCSKAEIDRLYVSAERDRAGTGTIEFELGKYGYISFTNPNGNKVAIAPVPATQLVDLPGIDNGAIFEPNLRQSLGRTKVNREILNSVRDKGEHGQFLLYHNGIVMVCEGLEEHHDARKISLSNVFVVNGCQSLSTLYSKKSEVSDDLCVIAKIVDVGRDSELVDKITHRSNNQNVIKPRDFKSNHPIQTRLQNEFNKLFDGSVFYEIKRGENPAADVSIPNDLAARLLLSFDLKRPYTAHQTYKLFDELYQDIFSRKEVTAQRIYVIYKIYERVVENLGKIHMTTFAEYTLTKFFMLHLVAEALRSTPLGQDFIKHPEKFLSQDKTLEALSACIDNIINDIVTDLNGEIEERNKSDHPFDFKRELKSVSAVNALTRSVVDSYRKLIKRGRVESFDQDWKNQIKKIPES